MHKFNTNSLNRVLKHGKAGNQTKHMLLIQEGSDIRELEIVGCLCKKNIMGSVKGELMSCVKSKINCIDEITVPLY